MRNANINDYVEWLEGYLAKGGKPSHFYARKFSPDRVFVADRDFKTGGECGASAVMILVNKGVRHLSGGIGHNTILYFDEFKTTDHAWIPIYADKEFHKLGLDTFIEEQRLNDARFLENIKYERQKRLEAQRYSDIPMR